MLRHLKIILLLLITCSSYGQNITSVGVQSFRIQEAIKLYEPVLSDGYSIKLNAQKTAESYTLSEDESFRLSVDGNLLTIDSKTDIGVIRGLASLADSSFKTGQNQPEHKWRGLLVDVCRHFIPLRNLKQIIQGMALAKMNVLHLHLTEDQGFRIESKKYPKLHKTSKQYFTQEQILELIEYADQYGIMIVPEFDMPGHASAWCAAHPEYCSNSRTEYKVETSFGVFKPTLDPTKNETLRFLDTLITEMAGLFPSPYFHIGGDEVEGSAWLGNPSIMSHTSKNGEEGIRELQAEFNKQINEMLARNGKIMIGWDEILDTALPRNIIIQSWRGKQSMLVADKYDYQTILSRGYYLDKFYSPWEYYSNNFPQVNGALGGEACMWSELADSITINTRIWPAAYGVGAALWGEQIEQQGFLEKQKLWVSNLKSAKVIDDATETTLMNQLTSECKPLRKVIDLFKVRSGYERHRAHKRRGEYNTLLKLNQFPDLLAVRSALNPDLKRLRLSDIKGLKQAIKNIGKLIKSNCVPELPQDYLLKIKEYLKSVLKEDAQNRKRTENEIRQIEMDLTLEFVMD